MSRRPYREQEAPFCVTPELTEGCNLYCSFCGLQGIREKAVKNYKFMAPETLRTALRQVRELGWNSRVEFAMRGEPTMHPDYAGMVRIAHEELPGAHKLMISNAGGLLRGGDPVANVQSLFDAGLNVLALDDYEDASLVPKVLERLSRHGELVTGQQHPLGFKFFRYPEDQTGNPHQRRPRGTRMLVAIRDIAAQSREAKKGNHGKLFNYAGAGFPKNDSMEGKRCHQPFRQLAIRYDGNVPICCNDWRGEYRCGSVLDDGVAAVWQSDAMGAAREYLIRGERSALTPCAGCDHRSYRVGLLPDLAGRGRLHEPDAQTAEDAAAAVAHGPYTPRVLRPWEIKSVEAARLSDEVG